MRPSLAPLLLVSLLGCASGRHVRTGDYAAASQDWEVAYSAYEQAALARPRSAKAQLRLSAARREVMTMLDARLAADLQARRFAEAGRLLQEASRYNPPRDWMDGHVETTLAAIRADVATRSLPEAHAVLAACAAHRPLSALSTDREAAGTAWADDLRRQARQAAGRGEVGAALVLLSGARQLREAPGDIDQHASWWSALRDEEWGGMYLSVRGPQEHTGAVSEALSARWAASPWSGAPVVSRAPDRPHLSAEVVVTAAGCEQAQVGAEVREHRYTDGTFVPNPRVASLQQQVRDHARSLREAEAALAQAQQRLDTAQRRQGAAEAAVASAAPWLEEARRQDVGSDRVLREARAEHAASLEARDAIGEREAEVAVLLAEQRERNAARRELEQRALPARQADLDRARQAHSQLAAAHAAHAEEHRQLVAALAAAEQRIEAAREALDRAQPILEAAAEAQAALPGHRSDLRDAAAARKEAREALQQAEEADEQATLHFDALRRAGDTPKEELDVARRAQFEAREALKEAREALGAAREEVARLEEGLAVLEATIQRGGEVDPEQARAALASARRDRDAAASALPAAEARQASAHRALEAADGRLAAASAAVQKIAARLDELDRADAAVARRLGQIEAEVSALGPSVGLLSARATTLGRAERDRQEAARRLREAEAIMAPLRAERDAASQQAAERQAARQQRDNDRTARARQLRSLESDLASTPAEVELVKVHPYTVARWQRTCTFTAAGAEVRSAATTRSDETWEGFDYGGLSADPLRYKTEDAVDLAASREAVVAAIWADLSGALRAQGDDARRRAQDPADLEAATRAWMMAEWLSPDQPDPALAASLRARYPVPVH